MKFEQCFPKKILPGLIYTRFVSFMFSNVILKQVKTAKQKSVKSILLSFLQFCAFSVSFSNLKMTKNLEVQTVDFEYVQEGLGHNKIVVVDVRPLDKRLEDGRIPGTCHVPSK